MAKDRREFIKVHNGISDHPKIEPLSDAAFRLLLDTWCYSSRHHTDGVLSATNWTNRRTVKVRQELLDAGLVIRREDGGVQLHDYLDWQLSAEEASAPVAVMSSAGKRGAHQRWHVNEGVVDPHCDLCLAIPIRRLNGSTNGHPIATPMATPSVPAMRSQWQEEEEEQEEERKSKNLAATTVTAMRAIDPIWDALVEACSINATEITGPMRGSLNKCVAELKLVGATAEEITLRARRYVASMPTARLTPPALTKHWPALSKPVAAPGPAPVLKGW